jgi:hypothetical protein
MSVVPKRNLDSNPRRHEPVRAGATVEGVGMSVVRGAADAIAAARSGEAGDADEGEEVDERDAVR